MLSRLGHKRPDKIWLRFLALSMPILIIPIIVMFFIYGRSIQVINQQTYEKHLSTLVNSAQTIERTIENMDNFARYLDMDSQINMFLLAESPTSDGSTTSEILKTQHDIKALTISNQLVSGIQVYSMKNDILIDSATIAITTGSYYNSAFALDGYSYDQWRDEFLLRQHQRDIYPSRLCKFGPLQKRRIMYSQSLPIKNQKSIISGNAFFYIDESSLLDLFRTVPYQKGGFFCILNNKNVPIIQDLCRQSTIQTLSQLDMRDKSGHIVKRIEGKDMFLTYYRGETNQWTYVVAIPKAMVTSSTNSIRNSILFMVIFALSAGSVLLFYSSKKLSRPAVNIYKVLEPLIGNTSQNTSHRELSYENFSYKISELVKHNEEMQKELQEQIPALKTSIFYSLLIGDFHTQEELRKNLSRIGVSSGGRYYVVLIAALNDLNSNNDFQDITAQKIYVNKLLQSTYSNVQGLYNLDFERTVLLIVSNETNYVSTADIIENETMQITQRLSREQNISISFSGDISDSIMKIPSSFYHALTAIDYEQKNPAFWVQWYRKATENSSGSFYYPILLESQISAMVKAGNTQTLPSLLDEIVHRNRALISEPPAPAFLNLLHSMNSTLTRIINDAPIEDPLLDRSRSAIHRCIKNENDLLQTFFLLKETFLTLANLTKKHLKQTEGPTQERVLQYIQAHFSDPQISLTSVSDVFQITEGYLSRLFKQAINENFSKYIERLRLEKANTMIDENRWTLAEIAKAVGYNSPQVFRRAYKRHFNKTPSERY